MNASQTRLYIQVPELRGARRTCLQDWELRPYLRAHVAQNPGTERPVHVPQVAQLVEEDRRLSPAQREEAPHLRKQEARHEYNKEWDSTGSCPEVLGQSLYQGAFSMLLG